MKYSARKISQCKNSYFYGTPPVAASGSSTGFMVFCKNSQENTQKKKNETLAKVFSCEFWKIYKNSFSYRIAPVATSVHVIPHSLASPRNLQQGTSASMFQSKTLQKMNTQNLHSLDISIALNPVIVTFYKKTSAGWLLLKKFIFVRESLSRAMNLLSLFLASLKIKFYARIFFSSNKVFFN